MRDIEEERHLGWTRRRVLAAAGATVASAVVAVSPRSWAAPPGGDPDDDDGTPAGAVRRLLAGNRRFAADTPRAPHRDPGRRAEIAAKQAPFAAVLGCADSRVPPEIPFDQGFGDLYVVRVAGNVATPEEVASLEFGTLVLGARAIVVLGHTRCGAVDAALAGKPVPGQIGVLFQRIVPFVDRGHPNLQRAVADNVRAQQRVLAEGSPVLAELAGTGKLAIVGAVYDLESGKVEVLS